MTVKAHSCGVANGKDPDKRVQPEFLRICAEDLWSGLAPPVPRNRSDVRGREKLRRHSRCWPRRVRCKARRPPSSSQGIDPSSTRRWVQGRIRARVSRKSSRFACPLAGSSSARERRCPGSFGRARKKRPVDNVINFFLCRWRKSQVSPAWPYSCGYVHEGLGTYP